VPVPDRHRRFRLVRFWSAAAGIAFVLAGAVMYVLPGPGLPVLAAGMSLLFCSAVLWLWDGLRG